MKEIITVDQLNFNFLGKIFGKKGVRLTDQGLLIDTKKGPTELISFAEVKRFAYIEEGFFGATLYVHNNQSLQEHKFLSKTDSTAFLKSINKKIAQSLQPHLLNLIEDFNLRVLSNYPRDSKIEPIKSLADELSIFYKDAKVPWDYFSNPKLFSEVEKIHNLYPIKQETLGAYHEKINLGRVIN